MSKATDIHKNNVLIGAGELYLDRLDENDMPTGERFLGDGVSASLSVTTERTQVFSGTGPVAEKLVDAVRSIDRAITIAVRDMSHENLALFVGAPEVGEVSDAAAAVTDEALTVRQARWYQLGAAKEKPMGVGAVSATAADTVVTSADGNTTYTADDYELDAERGRIHITAGGAITNGTALLIDYTPLAGTRVQVRTGGLEPIRAALRYIETPMEGRGRDYYARLCSVGAGGELALMNRDTEQQITLSAEILEPEDGWPALTIDGKATL